MRYGLLLFAADDCCIGGTFYETSLPTDAALEVLRDTIWDELAPQVAIIQAWRVRDICVAEFRRPVTLQARPKFDLDQPKPN